MSTFVRLGLLTGLTFLAGCGASEISLEGDATAARNALTEVLDAWKAGRSAEQLRSADPVVLASDEDWRAGRKLVDYEVIEEPVPNGGHWRVFTLLTFDGQQTSRKACYAVTLGSVVSVVRSDFLN